MSEVYLLRGGWVVRYDLAADAVVTAATAVTATWGPLGPAFADGLDAGLNYGNGKAYLFRGDQYVRLDIASATVEIESRSISDSWMGMGECGFGADLDAAVNFGNGTVYFFKGAAFASYDIASDKVTGVGSISAWLLAADGSFDADLDAVVNYGDGHLYVFKGTNYVKYSILEGRVVAEVRVIGDYWTGTAAAGFAERLDGSWCTAPPNGIAPPAQDPQQPIEQPTGQQSASTPVDAGAWPYRARVLALLDHYKGAVEGGGVFEEVVSAGALLAARRDAGTRNATYTTCVDFQQFVFKKAATDLGLTTRTSYLAFAAEEKGKQFGGWHAGTPGTTDRPRPGDVFVLYFTDPVGISHTGYLLSITVNGDGTETWTTVDGGQGTPGKYDAAGNLLQQGCEEFRETGRIYHPDTNLITGEANQDARQRTVHGWVDVDVLVNQ